MKPLKIFNRNRLPILYRRISSRSNGPTIGVFTAGYVGLWELPAAKTENRPRRLFAGVRFDRLPVCSGRTYLRDYRLTQDQILAARIWRPRIGHRRDCLSSLNLFSVPIIAAIAIPNLLAARRSANEATAIYTVRQIAQAESTYMETVGTRNCADLPQLYKNNLVDVVVAGGVKSGYRFVLTAIPNGCEIYATPTVPKGTTSTGTRSFFSSSDEGFAIRAAAKYGMTADKNDPLLGEFTQSESRPRIASQR